MPVDINIQPLLLATEEGSTLIKEIPLRPALELPLIDKFLSLVTADGEEVLAGYRNAKL